MIEDVLTELRAGRKRTHWMWFVFPQIAGLGASSTARFFAIRSLVEAEAYLDHDVLGPRLQTCTKLAIAAATTSATTLFGRPDDLKFRSSMTLFSRAAADPGVFDDALQKYFSGAPDEATLQRLA